MKNIKSEQHLYVTTLLCQIYNPIRNIALKLNQPVLYCRLPYTNERQNALIDQLIVENNSRLQQKNKCHSDQYINEISFKQLQLIIETRGASHKIVISRSFKRYFSDKECICYIDEYCVSSGAPLKFVFTPFYEIAKEMIPFIPKTKIPRTSITQQFIDKQYKDKIGVFLSIGAIHPLVVASLMRADADFIRKLIWRDYFFLVTEALDNQQLFSEYGFYNRNKLKWIKNDSFIKKWKTGNTGNDYIDYHMKQLKTNGWMPNRARMIVANYFCIYMKQDWRIGRDHFAQLLLDHDFWSNNLGWLQMSNLWLGRPYKFNIPTFVIVDK